MNRFFVSILVGLAAWTVSTALLIDVYVPSPCDLTGRCDGDMAFTLKVVGIWLAMFWVNSVSVLLYNVACWNRSWRRQHRLAQ